jgi:type II secretion system protein D
MKIKSRFLPALLTVCIVLGLPSPQFGRAQQNQRQLPRGTTPPPSRRPPAAQQQQQPRTAVTQPNSSGATPVIPYDDSPNALNFQEASADLVIMEYALRTGRTVIKSPGVPAVNITLRTTPDSPLDDDQYLTAIEQILNLNGIALEPVGDQFLKVVPSAEFRKHADKTIFPDDETGETVPNEEHGQFVSQMVQLKYIDISEAQGIITGFVRTGAQIQAIERTNSILITDSADTVNRIVEVLQYIDKPIIAREEPNIIQIKYAKAVDIKARLEEIIKSAQEEQEGKPVNMPEERMSGAPGTVRRQLPPGVSLPGGRGRRSESPAPTPAAETFEALIADAQRGIIRGKVSIIADERTNILIILTRPENMVFFTKFIAVLDVPTAPEVVVATYRLEHAVAADVANLLNELIGKRKPSESDTTRRSTPGREESSAQQRTVQTGISADSSTTRTKIGQLDSDNITILSDERTNALILMASATDMITIRDIIRQMDIMLSQVVVETAIISLTFGDEVETGVSWVQRAMQTGTSKDGSAPALIFATSGGGTDRPINPIGSGYQGSGANFLATLTDFNMDIILKAVQRDNRASVMNTPIITTLDNKEAVIESTQRVYYSDGVTYYSGSDNTTENIKNEDIGVKLKVTPRINKSGYIVLTIEQEWQELNGFQNLGDRDLPVIDTRKMGSDVAVQSGQTVVLGGLARKSKSRTTSKVPLLGDIPLLGWFFRSTSISDTRNELVIFLTPRVMDTPAQIEDEARSRKAALETAGIWDSGWSSSRLADPISRKEEKALQARGRRTVMPPGYPATRHLTPLNAEYGLELETSPDLKTQPNTHSDYTHYSDVDNYTLEKRAAEEAASEEKEAHGTHDALEESDPQFQIEGWLMQEPEPAAIIYSQDEAEEQVDDEEDLEQIDNVDDLDELIGNILN